jgi:hypothetical protein
VALNHGTSLLFYFEDPAGDLLSVYWKTAIACRPRPAALNRVIGDYEEHLLRASVPSTEWW